MSTHTTGNSDTTIPTARMTVSERIEAAAPEMTAKFRHAVESGKTRVTEWKGGIEDGIRERPIQSVLIAAAVGAVIGVLVGRRSR
jgi:ElaB/YqjD/DUF883 family membrane-anchored ribosome-binding protein